MTQTNKQYIEGAVIHVLVEHKGPPLSASDIQKRLRKWELWQVLSAIYRLEDKGRITRIETSSTHSVFMLNGPLERLAAL